MDERTEYPDDWTENVLLNISAMERGKNKWDERGQGMDNYIHRFKQKPPQETVKYIQNVLKEMNIEVEEKWMDENEIGTHSLRLTLKGVMSIGSNGKGMAAEYARASAYAEFLERLQNMRMTPPDKLIRIRERNGGFFFHPSEKMMSAEELVDEDNAFLQEFLQVRGLGNAMREDKIQALLNVQKMDYLLTKEYGKFICTPFYSMKRQCIVYVPYLMAGTSYASNGMCAGNTMEEAVVQGLSEIYERNANNRVMKEYISLPDIPEESIARFEDVYRMYKEVHANPKYTVFIKDASLGGQFPVVALVLIEKNTGKYGVKFGAHPNIGIALERIFTEATQGVTLTDFCRKSNLSFLNEEVSRKYNYINSFRTSDAQYPYQMLMSPPQYEYYEFEDNRELSNSQILKIELTKLLKQGYDVLIGDYSYTGFGSYHVLVPGLSELIVPDDQQINKALVRYQLQYVLGHPKTIRQSTCRTLMEQLVDASGNVLENTLYFFSGLFSRYPYPGASDYMDSIYLLAVCALSVGEYKLATEAIDLIIKHVSQTTGKVETDYMMLKKYIDGMNVVGNHDKVIQYLRYMFNDDLCNRYDAIFKDPSKAVMSIYPEIWTDDPYTAEFREYEEMIKKFKAYMEKHDVDLQQSAAALQAVMNEKEAV